MVCKMTRKKRKIKKCFPAICHKFEIGLRVMRQKVEEKGCNIIEQ